jgi:hypothetical protein
VILSIVLKDIVGYVDGTFLEDRAEVVHCASRFLAKQPFAETQYPCPIYLEARFHSEQVDAPTDGGSCQVGKRSLAVLFRLQNSQLVIWA